MTPVNRPKEVDENFVKEKEAAFAEFIQRKGLKTTRQRNTIIAVFFRLRGHISVEELLNEVKKVNPRIGYATVYRTLHLLVESNLVEERRFGDGLARYEGHSDVEHHDHMICLECGVISEFYNPRLEALQEKLAEENNFLIYRHRLELYGACKDKEACNKRKSNKAAEARSA
jgi:Fur family ferric uptake transcriptional regulator